MDGLPKSDDLQHLASGAGDSLLDLVDRITEADASVVAAPGVQPRNIVSLLGLDARAPIFPAQSIQQFLGLATH